VVCPVRLFHPPIQTYMLDNFTTQPSGNTSVPVLHCECEGSRIHDLLAFLEGLGSLGTGAASVAGHFSVFQSER
jgi:hypothetical protein